LPPPVPVELRPSLPASLLASLAPPLDVLPALPSLDVLPAPPPLDVLPAPPPLDVLPALPPLDVLPALPPVDVLPPVPPLPPEDVPEPPPDELPAAPPVEPPLPAEEEEGAFDPESDEQAATLKIPIARNTADACFIGGAQTLEWDAWY
jgi:hypothetical protein